MFRRRVISKKTGEGENPFLLTFSDFMASLLAIFILVLIVTLIELKQREDDRSDANKDLLNKLDEGLRDIRQIQNRIAGAMKGVSQREQALAVMLKDIQQELASAKTPIKVEIDEAGTIHIPENALAFPKGEHEIPDAQRPNAVKIGIALLNALSKDKHLALLDTVFIEGHTDSTNTSDDSQLNWRLSTLRAISLWTFWTDKSGTVPELKVLRTRPLDTKNSAKPLIAVSGYADTRSTHQPFDAAKFPADRPEDRRIDIRFTLVSSEKQSLEGLDRSVKEIQEKTDALRHELKKQSHAP